MLLVISFLVYSGLELSPGDAVSHMISPELASTITAEQLDAMREAYGLNQSFLTRYWIWLTSMVQGDMGYSMAGGVAISEIMVKTVPATLELSMVALFFSTILGCSLGVISALKRGSGTDNSLTVAGMAGVSIPEFFFGLVAILLFAIELKWLPVGGRLLPHYETLWDRIPNIVLPSLVLALMMTAGAMRYARSSMLDVLAREFITTARSKGMPEWRVNILHGFRVALTPVVVSNWFSSTFTYRWINYYRTSLPMARNRKYVYSICSSFRLSFSYDNFTNVCFCCSYSKFNNRCFNSVN